MKEYLINVICDTMNMVGKMIDEDAYPNEDKADLNDVWYMLDNILDWVEKNV